VAAGLGALAFEHALSRGAVMAEANNPLGDLIGSNTALQNYLGVAADGVFGPNSVKALQARLNAGTFFA